MKPILSICIPTFNRAEYLRGLLDSIYKSCKGNEDSIEVVISNNESTDHTEDVVNEYKKYFKQLRYHYHFEALLPGEKNFFFVSRMATGEYVWLIGDDDEIAEDAITIILDRLKSKPDMSVCNYSLMSPKFDKCIQKKQYTDKIPKVLDDNHKMVEYFGSTLSLISITIMRRSLFCSISEDDFMRFAEYGFSILFTVYLCATKAEAIQYIENSVLLYRCGNCPLSDHQWTKYFIQGVPIVFKALIEYGYTQQELQQVKDRTIKDYVLRRYISQKAKGEPTKHYISMLYKEYKTSKMFWIFCMPIFLIPGFLLTGLRALYQKIWR